MRAEFLQVAAAELAACGPLEFSAAAVVRRFEDRVPPTTAFRWIQRAKATGKLGSAAAQEIKARRLDRDKVASRDHPVLSMPLAVSIDDIAASGSIKVIDHINACIRHAQAVIAHATGEDGRPKASKLLLAASEHLRRCLETATRIAERMADVQRVHEFHRAILEEVRTESPEAHRRILNRLEATAVQWGSP